MENRVGKLTNKGNPGGVVTSLTQYCLMTENVSDKRKKCPKIERQETKRRAMSNGISRPRNEEKFIRPVLQKFIAGRSLFA